MSGGTGAEEGQLGPTHRDSFSRLAISDGLFQVGVAGLAAAAIGVVDNALDSIIIGVISGAALGVGIAGRRRFARRQHTATARILAGLASTWSILVLVGAATYLATGTIDSVENALFESAAGFSTVALTTLDPQVLSLPVALYRGATQWIGGLLGLFTVVVALPRTMKGKVQIPKGIGRRADRLVPTVEIGRRRVVRMYVALSLACFTAYLLSGMRFRSAAIHAMTTVSTGGFTDTTDSFLTMNTASKSVATVFMFTAGVSFFALFWLVRGNHRRFLASPELRVYAAIVATITIYLVLVVDDVSVGDALFTAASASSTTGLAVVDWTLFPPGALAILLVAVATGAMGASAGSGLRVIRAWLLVLFAAREVRRQLEPSAVIAVTHGDRSVGEDELEDLTGYQIAHFGLCAAGAFLLALAGSDLVGSLWAAISVISTFGPSPLTGAVGDATALGSWGQVILLPGMLAGRLTILPLLYAISSLLQARAWLVRGSRRVLRVRR